MPGNVDGRLPPMDGGVGRFPGETGFGVAGRVDGIGFGTAGRAPIPGVAGLAAGPDGPDGRGAGGAEKEGPLGLGNGAGMG